MTSTALNIARRELGEDSSPDLVAAASTVPAATIDRLAEAIGDAGHRPSQTPGSDQLWPLINARTSTFSSGGSNRFYARASGSAGLNLTAALDSDFAGSGKFPNGMLRLRGGAHLHQFPMASLGSTSALAHSTSAAS